LFCPALPAAFKRLTASRWFLFKNFLFCPALPAAFKKLTASRQFNFQELRFVARHCQRLFMARIASEKSSRYLRHKIPF
jgi:hypothetical protein